MRDRVREGIDGGEGYRAGRDGGRGRNEREGEEG